jgi:hypothetical protein
VSLLLGADEIALYPPAASADAHGWAEPGTAPSWTGTGNLQLVPGPSDPLAAGGGGHGPFDPNALPAGQVFLPPDAPLAEGCALFMRGTWYAASQVRLIADPRGPAGGLTCWAASVIGTGDWPGA